MEVRSKTDPGSDPARAGEPLAVHVVAANFTARIDRQRPDLPPALEATIETHWHAAQARAAGRLFNGDVFTVDTVAPTLLSGHFTEYRRIVAQMAEPALFATLQIRSLAVCGVIRCPDGVVLGRRDTRAAYQAGMWQLPPAGNVDGRAARADGTIDLRSQLLAELREEVGLTAHHVTALKPLCIVEHAGTHVMDFGFAIDTPLAGSDILAAHARAGDAAEYDPLTILAWQYLPDRIAALGPDLVPTARILLRQLGHIAPPRA